MLLYKLKKTIACAILYKDTHVIAIRFYNGRGKSMLAQTAMFVVFMLGETISQGHH